jgi:beta-lactamase superfamily II metal-dependent hydrolase
MGSVHQQTSMFEPDMAEAKVVPLQLSDGLLTRVEAQRTRLRQQTGLSPSQSQVIRMLIERGLAAVEGETSPLRKR